MTHKNKSAPGAPGNTAKWTSSSKSAVGKALDTDSLVAFTISHGILNEIYFPREDMACIRDMGFLVTDGDDFFSEEKRDTIHSITRIKTGVPAYQVVNTCVNKRYEIKKEIVTDPYRNTVLQNVSFKNNGNKPLHLCALIAPHLNNKGNNNSGWVDEYKGIPMLFAKNEGIFLAVACSSKWLKRSAGIVGVSDGWNDLKEHKRMQWEYTHADNGNIALTGEIDISTKDNFVLAISFGRNADDAAGHAWASILDGFESAKRVYLEKWEQWLKELHYAEGQLFQSSAGVLRMHEAKTFPGGIIASLSIPWGQTKGDDDKGGYHLVWPRDLVEAAGGFIALKTNKDALRILNYLMSVQKADGSWPQNMWLEGSPNWKGVQMDQTALPIVLMSKCNINHVIDKERMERYWPIIKKAIKFLIIHGPYTKQDRWEEEEGFTLFTLAAEIAGLLAGADLAEQNDEKALAAYCRETADYWNAQIESWTYVTDTSVTKKYNVDGYYIRTNPYHDIAAEELGDKTIDLKNHKDGEGKILINELVSVDALALVRFGLRAADDTKILNTIKVIDALLKVDTPNGACWHRYNNDGYGEDKEGNPYDGAGIGRAWPLLTGERAHYEIAAGNLDEARKLLKAMEAFSNNELLSEQIWDTDDIPEKELFFGQHSGSAMPLTWAHAEYIKLCASIKDNRVFDMPKQTYDRYIKHKTTSAICVWRFDKKCKIISKQILRIEVMAEAQIKWTDNNWETINTMDTKDTGIEIFYADIFMKDSAVSKIEFTFYWKETNNWEDKNFTVQVDI